MIRAIGKKFFRFAENFIAITNKGYTPKNSGDRGVPRRNYSIFKTLEHCG